MTADAESFLTLVDQARLTGAYVWIENSMFELLGSWVQNETSDEARLLFDAHSQQHAWHAELLSETLPVLDWVDREGLSSSAPNPEVASAIEIVGGAKTTTLRLVGVGRFVLARLVAGYNHHLERAPFASDASLARVLRVVVRDEIDAWQETEALTQLLLDADDEVTAASEHLRSLDCSLVGAGPGIIPWPTGQARDSRA